MWIVDISYALRKESVPSVPTEGVQCVRQILVVCGFDQKRLGIEAGAVGEEFAGDSPPCQLIALGI